jgi:glycosyltransferase involved in cell wall biosynthesis
MTSAAVLVDPLWFDVPGGVGTYVRNLVPALANDGVELRPFRSRFDAREDDDRGLGGVDVVSLPSSMRTLYPAWNALARPSLPASLRATDVVHATSAVAVPPAGSGQALVVTVHDLAFLRYPRLFPARWRLVYRLGLRAAARRADAILAPSESTAEDLVSRAGVDRSRVHVVPLAAAPPRDPVADVDNALERLRVPTPYVLSVGTIEPRKNLVTLVRAYRAAAATGIPHALVLAGPSGWGGGELDRETRADGPGRIERTGALSDADLDAVYRGAAMFAYPSLYEGFGLPVLEAMARGVPTIASNASSIPEVAGDAAILVDPRSPRELAEAIVGLATDTARASTLADAGRRRAGAFSWDETARRTVEAYERASGRRKARNTP